MKYERLINYLSASAGWRMAQARLAIKIDYNIISDLSNSPAHGLVYELREHSLAKNYFLC